MCESSEPRQGAPMCESSEPRQGGPMCESSEPRPLPSPTNPRAKAARESSASRNPKATEHGKETVEDKATVQRNSSNKRTRGAGLPWPLYYFWGGVAYQPRLLRGAGRRPTAHAAAPSSATLSFRGPGQPARSTFPPVAVLPGFAPAPLTLGAGATFSSCQACLYLTAKTRTLGRLRYPQSLAPSQSPAWEGGHSAPPPDPPLLLRAARVPLVSAHFCSLRPRGLRSCRLSIHPQTVRSPTGTYLSLSPPHPNRWRCATRTYLLSPTIVGTKGQKKHARIFQATEETTTKHQNSYRTGFEPHSNRTNVCLTLHAAHMRGAPPRTLQRASSISRLYDSCLMARNANEKERVVGSTQADNNRQKKKHVASPSAMLRFGSGSRHYRLPEPRRNGGTIKCVVVAGEAYRKNPEFQTQKIEKAPRVIVTSARVVRPSREASQQ